MNRARIQFWKILVVGSLMVVQFESCRHDPVTMNGQDTKVTTPPVTSNPDTSSINGALLYANNCAGCHGPLATSAKLGATVTQIQTGISNVGNMRFLSTLTRTQIQAIANALKSSTSTTPSSLDGTSLYASNCASCHGPLATSSKLGATAAQIQTGISTISNMQSLSSLTSAQIKAIALVLDSVKSTTPPSTDGATLYASYCASCHGPLASSAKIGATVSRIQNAISTVSQMSSLSSLTNAQITSISNVLVATPMPTDGPSLYSINCASCHGALASSSVGGSSVSDIQQAISQKSQMKYLSTLTSTQIQAIAGALANVRGGD